MQSIIPTTTVERVITCSAMQYVITTIATDCIIPRAACNKVGKFVAIKRIVFFRTGFMAEFFHRFFAQGFGVLFECAAVDGIQRILRHQR